MCNKYNKHLVIKSMYIFNDKGDTGLRGPAGEIGESGKKGAKGEQGIMLIVTSIIFVNRQVSYAR